MLLVGNWLIKNRLATLLLRGDSVIEGRFIELPHVADVTPTRGSTMNLSHYHTINLVKNALRATTKASLRSISQVFDFISRTIFLETY